MERFGNTFSIAPHSTRPSLSPCAIWATGFTSTNLGFSSRKFNFFKRYSMDSCVSIRLDLPFPASFCWRFLLNVAEKTSVCLGKSSGPSSSSSTSILSIAFNISSASLK